MRSVPRLAAAPAMALRLETGDREENMANRQTGHQRRSETRGRKLDRRKVLKGAAATAGLAAGSGAIQGFPTIWAQNLKDVTIVHTGMSYSTIIDIARQATRTWGSPWRWRSPTRPG